MKSTMVRYGEEMVRCAKGGDHYLIQKEMRISELFGLLGKPVNAVCLEYDGEWQRYHGLFCAMEPPYASRSITPVSKPELAMDRELVYGILRYCSSESITFTSGIIIRGKDSGELTISDTTAEDHTVTDHHRNTGFLFTKFEGFLAAARIKRPKVEVRKPTSVVID